MNAAFSIVPFRLRLSFYVSRFDRAVKFYFLKWCLSVPVKSIARPENGPLWMQEGEGFDRENHQDLILTIGAAS